MYLLRSNRLFSVTTPQRDKKTGELTSHLGAGDKLQLERIRIKVAVGDIIILCTDGVASPLDSEGIQQIVQENSSDMEVCALRLTREAAKLGDDNVTAICLKVIEL